MQIKVKKWSKKMQEKNKEEGIVTFQNIFSSMADFVI